MSKKKWKLGATLRSRALLLAVLLLAATCSDDGNPPGSLGQVAGVAYYGGPLVGANVTVRQYYQDEETITIGTATTAEDGSWSVDSGTFAGDFLVTISGGYYDEASGGRVTLDSSASLHAPIQDVQTAEKRRTVAVTPLSEVIWQLGLARLAAGQDLDYPAAIERARALVAAHVQFDPLSAPIAKLDTATGLGEPAFHALVLAGLSELAATASADLGVTAQAVNTRVLLNQLVRDASSAEARLDGNGPEVLSVGPACPLQAGCSMEQLGCYSSCSVYVNTMRSRLAASVLTWLRRSENRTGLDKTDVLAWVTELKDNTEPMLFGSEGIEPLDSVGPSVSFVMPAADAVVTGNAVPVEVTASDTLGVASIEVHTDTATPIVLVDTDPSPDRFVAMLDTLGLPDGPLRLIATARDSDDNMTEASRAIVTDNFAAGTISGIAVKGRLGGATVAIYTYANGVRGATPVGTGTTTADGSFSNVVIAEGTAGALLVQIGGGGTYVEEAFPNPTTTLDVNDQLTTIVPAYLDGSAVSGVVVTPLTSLAVAYFGYLTTVSAGGATVPLRWTTATAAIEAQFGVANIRDIVPLEPAQMTVLTAAARYGLVLVGISRTAWQASTAGGGDAGTFGSTVNAQKVVNAWSRDLADGCWNGKAGTDPLSYGGTRTFGDQATRLDLAQAIVAYLGDVAHNPTPFVSASDVLGLLDTLASGGGNDAIGSCVMTAPDTVGGQVFDDIGDTFDQAAPTIAFRGATPADGAFVKGTITIDALATDPGNIDIRPTLVFTAPMNTIDVDGDPTDRDALAMIDTLTQPEGSLPVTLSSEDDSLNVGTATRTFTVDNTAPVIAITSPATANGYYRSAVSVNYTVNEANLASSSATVDTVTIANGGAVTADGPHTLIVTATDRAMTTVTATRSFTIDSAPPTINVTAPAHNSYVQGAITLMWSINDGSPGATTTATLGSLPITSPHTFNDEGPHMLSITGVDAAGNPAVPVTRTFTIDNTDPTLTVNAPATGSYVRSPVAINFSATDNFQPPTVIALLDGSPILSGNQTLAPGSHTLVITATDLAGNAAPTVTRTFTVDNAPPTISVVAPAHGSFVQGLVTLSWSITDGPNPGATTIATLDNVTVTGTQMVVTEGSHTLVINGTDLAGNTAATVTRTFTIDNTRPVITVGGVTDGVAYNGSVTITYSAGDTYDPAPTFAGFVNSAPHPSGNSVTAQGAYTLVVTAVDRAGNMAIPVMRSFLIDTTPPTLSLTSQVPTGAFVRGMLTITVTGDDNLATSGSLGPNVTVSAVQGLTPVSPTLSYPSVAGGQRRVVATFPQAILSDGNLAVTFGLVDRAGNSRTLSHPPLVIDNTAPSTVLVTGIDTTTGAHLYNDATAMPPLFWVDLATPTLLGSFTEINPGSTVIVTVGAQSVTGTLTGASTWRGVVPNNSIPTGGLDATVTITDAAGNVGTGVKRLRYDDAAPSVAPIATTIRNETGDAVTFSAPGAPPSHAHNAQQVALGGPASACVTFSKYAYLTATTPVGLEPAPNGANPITFKFQASDAGAGIDPTASNALTYTVTAPGGQVRGPFPVDSFLQVAPGLYEGLAALHRDGEKAIPEIGNPALVREGEFTYTFYARDRVGRVTSLGRCWNHSPLGPPVRLVSNAHEASDPRWSLDSSLCSILGGSTCLAALMNATASVAMLELTVENTSGDPAYLTLTGSGPSTATYTASWRTALVYDRSIASTGPICSYDISTGDPPPGGNDPMCDGAYSGNPQGTTSGGGTLPLPPTVAAELWKLTGLSATKQSTCAGCGANQYLVPSGTDGWAALVSLTSLPGLRPPGLAGPHTIQAGLAGQFSTNPDLEACEVFSSYPPSPGYTRTRCTQRAVFRQFRGLRAASMDAVVATSISWVSRVAANLTAASAASSSSTPPQRRVDSYAWFTTE